MPKWITKNFAVSRRISSSDQPGLEKPPVPFRENWRRARMRLRAYQPMITFWIQYGHSSSASGHCCHQAIASAKMFAARMPASEGRSDTEVLVLDVRARRELAGAAAPHHAALLEHVVPIGDPGQRFNVLV